MTKKTEAKKEIEIFEDQSTLPVALDKIEENRHMLCTVEGALDPYIDHVKAAVSGVVIDYDTKEGRSLAGSLSTRISQSKKPIIDPLREYLREIKKDLPARILANIQHYENSIDAIRDEYKVPLDEWKAKEAEKLAAKQAVVNWPKEKLSTVNEQMQVDMLPQARLNYLIAALESVEAHNIEAADDLKKDAAYEKMTATDSLKAYVAKAKEWVEEEAKKKEEAAEAARIEQGRLIKEAESRAEQKTKDDLVAQEKENKRKADADEAAAKAKAEQEEIERLASVEWAEHRRTINRALLNELTSLGIDEDTAKLIIENVIKGKLTGLKLEY